MHSARTGMWKTVLLGIAAVLMLSAAAMAGETETVRVGYFYLEGYHEIDEDGIRDGYGYALMQSIRRYANLDFEYVGYDKTWTEMLDMLERGEIDVLSYVARLPEREDDFLFSEVAVGTCDVIFSVKAGNDSFRQGQYDTYNGRTIGFVMGIAENRIFAQFAREKGFGYRARYFGSTKELSDALQSGEVDGIVYTDFRRENNEWVMERMSAADVYMATRKENEELMDKLNTALKHLDSNESGWRSELKNTYYPYSATSLIYFTPEEREALRYYGEGGEVLLVTAKPDNAPYSWFERGEGGLMVPRGIYNVLFQRMAEEMGIRYRYIIPESYEEYLSLMRSGTVDIVVDTQEAHSLAENMGYIQTAPYDGVSMARIYARNFTGEPKVVACLRNMPALEAHLRETYPSLEIVRYSRLDAAVQDVLSGKVDFLYCLEHIAKTAVNQDVRGQLRYGVVGDRRFGITIAVRSTIPRPLVSAFCAMIEHSGKGILEEVYSENINFGVDRSPGLLAAIYNDPVPVIVIASVIGIIVVFSLFTALYFSRREREAVLRAEIENNAILSAMYTAMPFGLLRLEITDDEYNITFANRHFFAMVGAKDMEEANRNYPKGLGKGLLDRERYDVRTMYERLQNVGDSAVAESRARLPGGEIRWIRCSSTLVDIVGRTRVVQQLILDITEEHEAQQRKEREQADEAIGQMFGILTHNSSDIYILYSMDQHKTRFVSPNTEQKVGLPTLSAYEDLNVFHRMELDVSEEEHDARIQRAKVGEDLLGEVKRVHRRTGEIRWYRDESYVFKIGGESHVAVVMRDVTQERKRSEALQMALENAENASRAKTAFLSNISHDIRTPMNTIVGLTNLIRTDPDDREQVRRHLDDLEIAANSMMEIVNNVLDMSRIESGTTTLNEAVFRLDEVLAEVETICATQARVKDLKVTSWVELDQRSYVGDTLRLKQIFLNLVSNAVKYTPEGGGITLRASTHRRLGADHSIVRFIIQDTGIGMSEEFQREIFAPFTRERSTTVSGIIGTGLGMTIVKNMVDILGGTIQVTSAVGRGTTFTVDIPLHLAEEQDPQERENENEETIDLTGLRILLVEDNDLSAEIFMELMAREGVTCQRAENGRRCVEMFEASEPGQFHIILTDIQMPVMDGYEAARMIRASAHPEAATIPVSAMTANAFTGDIEAAYAAGMNAHIAKPVDVKTLKKTIKKLVKEW